MTIQSTSSTQKQPASVDTSPPTNGLVKKTKQVEQKNFTLHYTKEVPSSFTYNNNKIAIAERVYSWWESIAKGIALHTKDTGASDTQELIREHFVPQEVFKLLFNNQFSKSMIFKKQSERGEEDQLMQFSFVQIEDTSTNEKSIYVLEGTIGHFITKNPKIVKQCLYHLAFKPITKKLFPEVYDAFLKLPKPVNAQVIETKEYIYKVAKIPKEKKSIEL